MNRLQVLRFGLLLFAMMFVANFAFAKDKDEVAVCFNGVTSYEKDQKKANKFIEDNLGATLGACAEEEEEEEETPPTPPQESEQVTICHYESEDEEWKKITINENALGGHENHNDGETPDFVIGDEGDDIDCDNLINGGEDEDEDEVDETAPDMPVHVSPADGVTLTSAELTEIQWTDVTDPSTPVSYFYESANNSGTNPDGSFTSPVYHLGL